MDRLLNTSKIDDLLATKDGRVALATVLSVCDTGLAIAQKDVLDRRDLQAALAWFGTRARDGWDSPVTLAWIGEKAHYPEMMWRAMKDLNDDERLNAYRVLVLEAIRELLGVMLLDTSEAWALESWVDKRRASILDFVPF